MVKRIKGWDKLNGIEFNVNGISYTLQTTYEGEEVGYTAYRAIVRTPKIVQDVLAVVLYITLPDDIHTVYTLELREPGSVTKREVNIPDGIMRDFIEFKREFFTQITSMIHTLNENQQWIRNSGLV